MVASVSGPHRGSRFVADLAVPTAPLSVCAQPGCPSRVTRGYCSTHARTSTRNHRGVSRQARGYDRTYEKARAGLMGQPCALRLPGCTGVADSADHHAGGLRPACQHCNYADGARQRPGVTRTVWRGRELIVLMGAPGSGKSTYAKRFPRWVTTDALRVMKADGRVVEDVDVDGLFDRAFSSVVAVLKTNQRVVLDTPAAHPLTRQRALAVATAYHASARLVVFTTDVETCVRRQADRQFPVPEEVVRRMHAEVEAQRVSLADEGWTTVADHAGVGG